MSKNHYCYAGKKKLPCSVYLKNQSLHICRGTPSEMVLQMVTSDTTLTLRDAIKVIVNQLASTRNLHVELPWDAPDEILSTLLLKVMLDNGIVGPTPIS